jgi:hypothetical protein
VVRVAKLDSRNSLTVIKTDATGRFSVYGLRAGEYRIRAMKSRDYRDEFTQFTLEPGEHKANLKIVFAKEGFLAFCGTGVDRAEQSHEER